MGVGGHLSMVSILAAVGGLGCGCGGDKCLFLCGGFGAEPPCRAETSIFRNIIFHMTLPEYETICGVDSRTLCLKFPASRFLGRESEL